ncbi:autotransporter outer membrane beta-barrel domain-containing protein [Bradyrhizobium sp.]|uniref:autotransporter outer membrane beta-barrel domain-containing protein n=1 Tax=Bradyrhizobium sp. TaxID=376 RepID=UPI002DDD265C|nr:autotransporter domain-containing protein [Bradyrhizobium sp.]HEV2156910.1 autotransporter domain-containing protein [Bradyrhizobium sp.]
MRSLGLRPLDGRRLLSSASVFALTLSVGQALPDAARAADWTGTTSSDWFVTGNWNTGTLPTSGVNVFIATSTPNPAVIAGPNAATNNLSIGDGLLTISGGGQLTSSGIGSIGYTGATNGTVLVDGAGSTWTSVGSLYVGHITSGSGTLSVTNGAKVVSGAAYVGYFSGSTGTASIDGAGSAWISNADMAVGQAGTGLLTISNGGHLTDVNGLIADTHMGTVTISGAGSTWTNTGNLVVGNFRQGTLSVTAGGTVTSVAGKIGAFSGSTSTATVNGTGSTWTNSGQLTVGDGGEGKLIVSNGGAVSNTVGLVGSQAGSIGTVTVDGTGSTWTNSADLTIGKSGAAALTISSGGTVSNTLGYVGYAASSTAAVTVSGAGSTWINSSTLAIGRAGTGTLAVANGGTVKSVIGYLGNYAKGFATVDGVGSTWNNSSALYIGVSSGGDGTLTISNAGSVSDTVGHIGNSLGSTGAVAVTGAGSSWSNSMALFVGDAGTGTLTIVNGGAVDSVGGVIGNIATGTGTVAVSGAGSTWTNSGSLTVGHGGSGTLNILNGGAVSNTSATVGNGSGAQGTVVVDGAGSTWTNSSGLTVGNIGSGALTISNGGMVSVGGAAVIAAQAGSAGALNIGSVVGSAAAGAGTLNATNVQFGLGDGAVNFNHTDANYTFGLAIAGFGTINQIAGNTNLTADSSAFTGATNVTGGRLAVNGSLANSLVTVSGGGMLGGNGTVGGIVANAGGTIGPGNSIGTLNVNGNIAQAAGSTYQVELTSTGLADRINATGTATIANGAVLNIVKLDAAPYVLGTHYTVLQANGGVSGTYTLTGDTALSAFIGLVERYDPTHVYLDVAQTKSFAAAGLTPNQRATGAGTDSLGSGNPIYDAVLMLPTDAVARRSFDQLSGEVHASAKAGMIEDSRFVRDAALDRLRDAFDAVGAVRSPVMTYVDGKPVAASATSDRFAVWGRGFGAWGQSNGNGNAATIKRDIGGFFMGADGVVGDTWRVGMLGGYSRSTFNVGDRSSSGSSDNYHVGLYGGTQWGDLAFRSGAAYTWHDISTSRSVAFPGFGDSLKGNYNAGTAQAFGEFGYAITMRAARFEPFANLAYVSLSTDGFTEKGGAAALASGSSTTDAAFTTLGLRASTRFDLYGATVTAKSMLGWRHAFGDTTPLSQIRFAGGGDTFSIGGVPIARNAAAIEAGLDYAITPAAMLGVSYGGQFGSGLTDQSLRANFNVRF